MSSRDGVERFRDKKTGEWRYRLRLIAYHPDTGKKFVDTQRVVKADGRPDALKQKEEMTAELVAQKLGEIRLGKRYTFAEAADEWHATIKRHATSVSWGSYRKKLNAVFGERMLDSITRDEFQRYLARLDYARSTVKGHKAVIVRIYEWAAGEGIPLPKPSPVEGLKLAKRRSDPVQVLADLENSKPAKMGLDQKELARFMPALHAHDQDMHTLVLVQLSIGARFAEASALQRSDVDMQTGELVVKRGQVYGRVGPPKKDKSRAGAIPRTALEHLRKHVERMDDLQWPGHETWLFPAPPKRKRKHGNLWNISTVAKAIKKIMAELGIETQTATHFARHTLNGLIRGHVADSVLYSVVGHADQKQNAAYGDARVLDFAAEVERVILKKAGGGSGGNQAAGEG